MAKRGMSPRDFPEQPDQMALVDHDCVVQTFPAGVPTKLSAIAFAFGARSGSVG
jgi:hypothetical protein